MTGHHPQPSPELSISSMMLLYRILCLTSNRIVILVFQVTYYLFKSDWEILRNFFKNYLRKTGVVACD